MRARAAAAWQAHAPLTIETVDLQGRKSGQGLAIALAPQRWALGGRSWRASTLARNLAARNRVLSCGAACAARFAAGGGTAMAAAGCARKLSPR